MVEIRPFKAIRYTEKAGDCRDLIAQPYDKINQDLQKEYYEKSERNYCRLTLPIEENRYEISKQRIRQWMSEGILRKDETPAIFVYRQEFRLFGKTHTRTGFIAALRLHPYEENEVLPHETTHKGPKIDRLNMLRSTQKNLEAGFLLYPDPDKITTDFFTKIARTNSLIDAKDSSGVRNLIWRLTNPKEIELVQKAVVDKQFVIADGHHRYETAIAYRDERRGKEEWDENSAFNFRMSYMVPIQDEGLIVLPTHRLLRKIRLTDASLRKLKGLFTVSEVDASAENLRSFLSSHRKKHAFCVYDGKKAYSLLLKDEKTAFRSIGAARSEEYRSLDVTILRDVIFKVIMKTGELKINEDILYVRWIKNAMEKVDKEEAKLAFLVNPITSGTVLKIARKKERMPEKSTDFYPKMVSGFTMMDLSLGEHL
ncbi:MAG: DUF1015 domain-containing protein [Candidatus Bathyarchaeota archaeon]|nr:MAG: DUF1015 domain-containing protein [Candidatus Bathyarchaeota archaeon]